MSKTWACETAIIIMIAVSLLFLLLFFPVCQVSAWDLSTKLALGYDDNPGQETAGEETFFTLYQLGGAEQFSLSERFSLQTFAYVSYRDMVEIGDNFTGGFTMDLTSPFWQGKGLATFFVNPELYRDHYSREDEVNSVNMGLETTYFLTPTLDLFCKGQVSYINYCHEVTPFAGHRLSSMPNMLAVNGLLSETLENGNGVFVLPDKSSGQALMGFYNVAANREDWLYLAEVSLEKSLLGPLSLQIGTSYRSLHSTIAVESFAGIGLTAGLDWLPAELWSISINGWWMQRVYERAPGGETRHDYERGTRLSIIRSWAKGDVFVDFMIMRNQSPLDLEDYRRKIIQCGATFLF